MAPSNESKQSHLGIYNAMMRAEGRHLFTTSDEDDVIMKQILATHAYDCQEIDVRALLKVVEEIFQPSTPSTPAPLAWYMDRLDQRTEETAFVGMPEALVGLIYNISCEVSCKCVEGENVHLTTVALFNLLSSYSWDAKMVLALAAFAITYGDFCLVANLYPTHPLAVSITLLKQLPGNLEQSETLTSMFKALRSLIKDVVDMTKCVVQLHELPPEYISADQPPLSVACTHILTAVYWTIRSVISWASEISGIVGTDDEYIPLNTGAWSLFNLAYKVKYIREHLLEQLALCNQQVDEKKDVEAYQNLVQLFETMHIENTKVLRALIYAKDDLQPLIEGNTKKQVSLEVLRWKTVLLLLSDLDISLEELSLLREIYNDRLQPTRKVSYEVVWIPMVADRTFPWPETKERDFDRLRSNMPWYSVYHPSLIKPDFLKYIKEVWCFKEKPVLVVLDQHGRVINLNALHMIWIWRSLAIPFSSMKEEILWKTQTWSLEFLVVDPEIHHLIAEERFICLYGGENINWITEFTMKIRRVAEEAGILFEMVYVGKSNPKLEVKRSIAHITKEKLSSYLPDLNFIWSFWVRLERMCYSKMRQGKTIKNDPIMQEIMTILTFDASDQGWALISKGSTNMAKAKGDMILTCFQQYDLWREYATHKGFVEAVNEHLLELQTLQHYNSLILPATIDTIPETMFCAECGCPMENLIMYRCCID